MSADGRVYLRVSETILAACKRLAKSKGMRPGSLARELIAEGHKDGSVPALVPPPYRQPLNVSLPTAQRAALEEAAREEAARIGQPLDLPAYARRCLHRGLELLEQAKQQPREQSRRRSKRSAQAA